MHETSDSPPILIQRWELEGLAVAMLVGALVGGFLLGVLGSVVGAALLGITVRFVERRRQASFLPDAARALAWAPVVAVDLLAQVVESAWAAASRTPANAAPVPSERDAEAASTVDAGQDVGQAAPPVQSSPIGARGISGAMFGLVILSFFMTFAAVSCGPESFEVSGMQMVTGTEIEGQQASFGIFPKLAFGMGFLGLLLSILPGRGAVLPAACGLVGVVALFALKSQVESDPDLTGLTVTFENGFWSAGLFFFGASVLNGWRFLTGMPQRPPG